MHLISRRSTSLFSILTSVRSLSAMSTSVSLLDLPTTTQQALDTTWFLAPPSDHTSFDELHLPNAHHFDVPKLGEKDVPGIIHAPPSPTALTNFLSKAAISSDTPLTLYQTTKGMCMYRAYYLLKHFYLHPAPISILQTPVDALPATYVTSYATKSTNPTIYTLPPTFEPAYPAVTRTNFPPLLTFLAMHALVTSRMAIPTLIPATIILDARGAARFTGDTPEPRDGMRSGHIPTSKNLPFTKVVEEDYTRMKSAGELRGIFEGKGVDFSDETQRVVVTCGSGVTACYLAAGLEIAGMEMGRVAVYDGSWSEWGGREDTPIEGGEEQV